MVTKLPMPEYDSLEVVNSVISERRHFLGFYRSISADLRAQILSYIEVSGDPSLITALNLRNYTHTNEEAVSRKKSLINLYSPNPNKAPYDILEEMRNGHGLLFCPSCGEDGAPGTLDHYLPKTEFPELAICIANLTPMCSKCQIKKSDNYVNDDGRKAYIHPYYDDIIDCLFHVDIEPPFNRPSVFNVAVKNSIQGDYKRLVESHINGIEFKKRFEKYCETKHLHLIRMMVKEREDEEPMAARHVIRLFLRQEREKALNTWGYIYYQSVLDTPALLDYLDNGDLPHYI